MIPLRPGRPQVGLAFYAHAETSHVREGRVGGATCVGVWVCG